MSNIRITVTVGGELPSWTFDYQDNGVTVDLTGHTFTLRVGHAGSLGVLQKTTGITPAATDPNITVDWSVGEWDAVPPGNYSFTITPRRTSDSKDREPLRGMVQVLAAIPAP